MVDQQTLAEIDRFVRQGVFPSRNQAIEDALHEHISKLHRSRLARECARLDVREQQALAEECYAGDTEWPAY